MGHVLSMDIRSVHMGAFPWVIHICPIILAFERFRGIEVSSKYVAASLAFGWIRVHIPIRYLAKQELLSSLGGELLIRADIVDSTEYSQRNVHLLGAGHGLSSPTRALEGKGDCVAGCDQH
jgi:hypothetical protein